jgi:hypothetical protein
VFVDLYVKNRQLKEQAALLRQRLTAAGDTSGRSAADVVGELSDRLAAVEEQVEMLAEQAAAQPQSAAPAAVAELRRRTSHLREAVAALGARAPEAEVVPGP